MIAALLGLYAAMQIAPPAGMAADLEFRDALAPRSIAISRSGAVALIVTPPASGTSGGVRLLVVRPDGCRVLLGPPSDELLTPIFKQYVLGSRGEHQFPDKRFTSVALADDGTPFVTVAASFNGAFAGEDDAVFVWNGRWVSAFANGVPFATGNAALGAAQSLTTFVANGNYANYFGPMAGSPQEQEDRVIVTRSGESRIQGNGDALAVRNDVAVGTVPGHFNMAPSAQPDPVAMEWRPGGSRVLGPGIARGVNASGLIVGDDETSAGNDGHPTAWIGGRQTIRYSRLGTAHAIADDGTIVGSSGQSAFVGRIANGRWVLTRLDELLDDRGWHVVAAYGISSSGRILAVGRRQNCALRVLLLKPTLPA